MKKLLLFLTAMLLTTATFSQNTTMDRVLGIKLGISRNEVKAIMKSNQPESVVYSENEISLSYDKTEWGAYKPLLLMFQFDEDKLHTVHVFISPEYCKDIFYTYDDVVDIINGRYYTTSKFTEHYKYPYTKSDKYKYTTILVKNDYVTMQSLWSFDTRNTPNNSEDDNNIMVTVTDDCNVKVTYQDGYLIDVAVAKEKAKQSKDY